ncbi:MAG TPA: arylesterase [Burkholderiales bacterium]|nr:arylesterase [Burkholderiales bacterium]
MLQALAAAVLLAALLAGASACGDRGPRLSRLDERAVVLAFGDSLTYGTGASADESYPAQLETLIARRVVSAGVPGEVTGQALKRLPEALDEHAPSLLLLCIGGNDFLQRRSLEEAARNVRAMVKLARSRDIEVLLIGTPAVSLTAAAPTFYREIADEYGIPYEPSVIGEVLRDSALKADPVHPNAKGYRVIAERLAERLRESGAL